MTPARFVRLFQPRFAPLVESGAKPHTVRPRPRRMPAPGDLISLRTWTGRPYRSRQRILRESVISEVCDIGIYGDSIHLRGRRLPSAERETFARADGFASFAEMAAWFRDTHGLPFEGIVIFWQP